MNISQTNLLAIRDELETSALRCSKAAACIDEYIRNERRKVVESLTADEPDGGPDPCYRPLKSCSDIYGPNLIYATTSTTTATNEGSISVTALMEHPPCENIARGYTGPIDPGMTFSLSNPEGRDSVTVIIEGAGEHTPLKSDLIAFTINGGTLIDGGNHRSAGTMWSMDRDDFRRRATLLASAPAPAQETEFFAASPDWAAIAPDLLRAANFLTPSLARGPILPTGDAERIAGVLRGLATFHTQGGMPEIDEAPEAEEREEVGNARQSRPDSRAHVRADARARPLREELEALIRDYPLYRVDPSDKGAPIVVNRILDRLIAERPSGSVSRMFLDDVKAGRL